MIHGAVRRVCALGVAGVLGAAGMAVLANGATAAVSAVDPCTVLTLDELQSTVGVPLGPPERGTGERFELAKNACFWGPTLESGFSNGITMYVHTKDAKTRYETILKGNKGTPTKKVPEVKVKKSFLLDSASGSGWEMGLLTDKKAIIFLGADIVQGEDDGPNMITEDQMFALAKLALDKK
jgi:hypothetical protein